MNSTLRQEEALGHKMRRGGCFAVGRNVRQTLRSSGIIVVLAAARQCGLTVGAPNPAAHRHCVSYNRFHADNAQGTSLRCTKAWLSALPQLLSPS